MVLWAVIGHVTHACINIKKYTSVDFWQFFSPDFSHVQALPSFQAWFHCICCIDLLFWDKCLCKLQPFIFIVLFEAKRLKRLNETFFTFILPAFRACWPLLVLAGFTDPSPPS